MNWQELYESEKKKREAAEAKVGELQTAARTAREDEHLGAALHEAGVPPSAWKDAARAMRREAEITFDDRGAFGGAELGGNTYANPVDFARAFLRSAPHFGAEHINAVKRSRGESVEAAGGADPSGEGDVFTGAEAWKNGTPGEIAELAWSQPPAPVTGADPFADFTRES